MAGIPYVNEGIGAVQEGRKTLDSFISNELGSKFGPFVSGLLGLRGGPPNTRARLSHAFTLRNDRGRIIAAVNAVNVRQSRSVDFEFEVDVNGVGDPADIVPQQMTAQQMTVKRWDLYRDIMEETFGTDELTLLTDQKRGLRLREVWKGPTGLFVRTQRFYLYEACWFTDLGREIRADGDRTINADATITWLRRRQAA